MYVYIYIYTYIYIYIYIYINKYPFRAWRAGKRQPPSYFRGGLEYSEPQTGSYTRSPSQDSPSQDFRQGLGCSGTHLFHR